MALLAVWDPFDASATQRLLPTPYPEQLGPNAQIGGGARRTHRHQHLLPDPVPQTLGRNAAGNPKPYGRHRHQHLLRTPYWRQYHHWR
ncbi:hypothetical protein [Methylocapsa aurea]|uniref:hypothetical protein n=1 Tax=Methylocapsa aurea TaxID=663610 RepID=UPI000559C0C3|nr:hypothetical protein [Methylocapsa aurea]